MDPPEVLDTATEDAYPKPGHGLYHHIMGPEADDLDFLLDDNDEVYSHVILDKGSGDYEPVLGAGRRGAGAVPSAVTGMGIRGVA